MKSSLRLAMPVLVAVGLAVVASAPASAQEIIDFGVGYACEGTRAVNDHTSTLNDVLVIVGKVVGFNSPFDDLDPNDPTREYTYVYKGLVSNGDSGAGPFYTTTYTGGTLEIYDDPAQNADFADKTTFEDGTLILGASILNFSTTTNAFGPSGNQSSDLVFNAGTLLSRVSGCTVATTFGSFSVSSALVPGAQQAQGYFGFSDSKIDAECPTPVEPSTWGSIKRLYQ